MINLIRLCLTIQKGFLEPNTRSNIVKMLFLKATDIL